MRWVSWVVILSALTVSPLRADMVFPTNATGLYIADTGSNGVIRFANLDGSNPQTLVSAGLVRSLAVDPVGGSIYWIDDSRDGIFRSNLDGSNPQQIISQPTVGADGGLALDLVHGKIYWTNRDPSNRGILRANLDGSGVETLLSSGLGTVHAISLDVAGGKFYFANGNQIQSANLDGSNLQTVFAGVISTYGLALDLDAKKIYWSQVTSPTGFIKRANLDGTGIQTLVTGLVNSRGIALDAPDGFIYFTEFTNQAPDFLGTIGRVNLDGSNRQTVDTFTLSFPQGVAVVSPSSSVPEPGSFVLVGLGLAGIAVYARGWSMARLLWGQAKC